MNPFVNIIIPVFNRENYLQNIFKQIDNQTYKNIKVVFVDDGSTDNSYEMLMAYKKTHKNIYVLKQTNAGPGVARNKALDYCENFLYTSKYLICLDSDDIYSDDLIETLVNKIEQKKSDVIVYSLHWKFEGQKKAKRIYNFNAWPLKSKTFVPIKYRNKLLSTILNCGGPVDFMVKLDLVKKYKIRFQSISCSEDIAYSYCLFVKAKSITILDNNKPLYTVIKHKDSTTFKTANNLSNIITYECPMHLKNEFMRIDSLNDFKDTLIKWYFGRCIFYIFSSDVFNSNQKKLTFDNLKKNAYKIFKNEEMYDAIHIDTYLFPLYKRIFIKNYSYERNNIIFKIRNIIKKIPGARPLYRFLKAKL